MKKVLFICNTYLQLINAIQIKISGFDNDHSEKYEVDLLLSDYSRNTEAVAKKLEELHMFRRVKEVKIKEYTYTQGIIRDFFDVMALNFGKNQKYRSLLWDDMIYDMIFSFQYGVLTYTIFDMNQEKNKQPECIFYEEAISSYADVILRNPGKRIWLTKLLRKMIPRKDMSECYHKFYCYYPECVPAEYGLECRQITAWSREDQKLRDILNYIFVYIPEKHIFPQKYIYFATSTDIDGKPVGETEIVLRIADLVGKENLLVKMHPRDDRTIYEDNGLIVSRESAIPWEVVQLNHDFSGHIFISLSSNSVLSATAILGDDVKGFFLSPMVRGKNQEVDLELITEMDEVVKQLHSKGKCMNIQMVSDFDQFKEQMERI
ncbi:MAG: alpha-2,8-polysialyltransferase family protein [Lachnospiraceae bacterium]|nr:alpha-2,8-polysialyltransferase family protein [Lachnospiraceae bacterium]MCM1238780.1 alpha-2,8-polysialyltransferase family protein [Lachnospiraceae bacterium]